MSDITLVVSAPGPTVELTADAPGAVTVTVNEGGGVSTHAELSDLATSGHPASVIAFTPTGSIAATTVQAAVAEVATDAAAAYQPLDSDLTAIAALTTPATTISGAVQQSLVDAAGDLLVGSAADTLARLPMGTALQTLRVNAGATGLEYAAASGGGAEATGIGVSQEAFGLPGAVWTYGNFYITCTANRVYYFPFKVDAAITITKVAVKVDTLAALGKGLVGCYASSGALQPTGASLLTSGELDTSSTGLKQTTGLSVVLTPGIYLASFQASVSVTLTCASYGVPGLMQLTTGMATWAQNHYVARTYDATNPNPAPAWDTSSVGSTGFQGPVGFAWTVN